MPVSHPNSLDFLSATYPGTKAKRSHVTGAINFPMADVIGPNGFLSQEEVDAKIAKLGLTAGNKGSMTQLAYRAPELVNTTGN
ncbi:Protein CBG11613 [Caenorhabditis briggsae]|uniref:Protein CBG11613 n=1 Tax=Caenorhabditis briggsae TaxID=6238 RepID=A8XDM3_CAEBR|nr:Protein CBG11613 [Caenorhabditis briggsae]CAP30743.1 Protein CBG11613 [Caenorhabditis briggsae]